MKDSVWSKVKSLGGSRRQGYKLPTRTNWEVEKRGHLCAWHCLAFLGPSKMIGIVWPIPSQLRDASTSEGKKLIQRQCIFLEKRFIRGQALRKTNFSYILYSDSRTVSCRLSLVLKKSNNSAFRVISFKTDCLFHLIFIFTLIFTQVN